MAFAEGNALGKGPQILRLGPEDVAWIRRRAAAGDPVFMQLEVRHGLSTQKDTLLPESSYRGFTTWVRCC